MFLFERIFHLLPQKDGETACDMRDLRTYLKGLGLKANVAGGAGTRRGSAMKESGN
jgi:hypothetical protein